MDYEMIEKLNMEELKNYLKIHSLKVTGRKKYIVARVHWKKITNVIMWEMHGFPHKFTTVRENATKIMVWRKPGKLILILFP